MSNTAICLDQITRDFGSARALDHLSLQVPARMIYGFLGPNGAGKTTTINLLLDVDLPDLDALETSRQLRVRPIPTAIPAMSADDDNQAICRLSDAGAVGVRRVEGTSM